MTDQDYIERLEKRVHNLELSMLRIVSLIVDVGPVAYAEDISDAGDELYDAAVSLGATLEDTTLCIERKSS